MILGLDMSSKKSGYSLFDSKKLIDYGVWEMSFEKESDWRERILFMATQLSEYIDSHTITQIYVEDVPPIIENTQTVKVLSALQGCVLTICRLHNIQIEFIPNNRWKNLIGIDITHSKANKTKQKELKLIDKASLPKLKKNVKGYEKKMSVDYANKIFDTDLIWKSYSSKFNQDDIADAINLVASQIYNTPLKYDVDTFENIINNLYSEIKDKNNNASFGKKARCK